MDWTSAGFRLIYKAKQDKFYTAPAATKLTTIGDVIQVAKNHIAAQGNKLATLQSHCHAFALAVYNGV